MRRLPAGAPSGGVGRTYARHMKGGAHFRNTVAGLVVAGLALALGEFAAGLSTRINSVQLISPVVAVGDLVVDVAPGALVRASIRILGTAQKPMLLGGITIVALLIGALLARRSMASLQKGLPAFGVLSGWAMARSPVTGTAAAWLLAFAVVAVSLAAARVLRTAMNDIPHRQGRKQDREQDQEVPRGPLILEDPRVRYADRRGFLAYAGGMTGTAVALVGAGRFFADRSAQQARARVALPSTTSGTGPGSSTSTVAASTSTVAAGTTTTFPPPGLPDVPGLSPWITPNGDFYRIDTALTVPIVDPVGWSMTIDGMVDQPITLTLDDLLAMDILDATVTIACVSNAVGGSLVGNANWTGVLLADVLRLAGPQEGAEQIMAWSVDGFSAGFPLDVATDGRTALVAFGMNGEPLPLDHGFPVRLIVPGLYGYVSAVKWLSHLELTSFEREGYWIDKGWSRDAPVKIASRIDVPATGRVEAGTVPVAGVAWYPDVGVAAVEVSIDYGPWQTCQLGEGDAPQQGKPVKTGEAWVQWLHLWEAEPGRHRIRVRAVGTDGTLQPGVSVAPAPNGAEGYHEINLTVA